MKTSKTIIFCILLFLGGHVQGQFSVRLNIGVPPQWGPDGFADERYYYLPDIETYYDVQSSMFIFYNNGAWIHRRNLPQRFKNYDLYGGYKVVLNGYRGTTPYDHFNYYKKKYGKGYRGVNQRNIRDSHSKENSFHNNRYQHFSRPNDADYNNDTPKKGKKNKEHDGKNNHK